jgi:uncharacterized DUF497 family protein
MNTSDNTRERSVVIAETVSKQVFDLLKEQVDEVERVARDRANATGKVPAAKVSISCKWALGETVRVVTKISFSAKSEAETEDTVNIKQGTFDL